MQMSYDISFSLGDDQTSKWCFVCG